MAGVQCSSARLALAGSPKLPEHTQSNVWHPQVAAKQCTLSCQAASATAAEHTEHQHRDKSQGDKQSCPKCPHPEGAAI